MNKNLIQRLAVIFLLLIAGVTFSIAQSSENPPLPGFDAAGSDAKAIEIADEVMVALGGRKAWDNTRHITWKFFGRRLHVWDKWSGNIRVESKGLVVLMNLNTREGRAWQDGEEITQPDSLTKKLSFANSAWINDSYWLVMPYKLKDSGVTLKYHGEGTMENNRPCDILQLTFQNVGDTPQNKYLVYVDKETRLVEQWSFFREASDQEPGFTNAWVNWQKHGEILLSDDRGTLRGKPIKHTDIAVFEELPASVYESPQAVDMMGFVKGD